jgi:hypothetical protein
MTTTSPTSSMATSLLTRKPERGGIRPPLADRTGGARGFFAPRPLWTPQVFGYTAALGKQDALRPNRSRDVFGKMGP